MVQQNREYRDLDLNLIPHPVTGDVNILKESEAVKRSIRNLVFTNFYERFFRRDVGSGVVQLLFEPLTVISQRLIQTAIEDVIRNYEPRAEIISVDVRASVDENGYEASILFYIVNQIEPIQVDLFLKRVR